MNHAMPGQPATPEEAVGAAPEPVGRVPAADGPGAHRGPAARPEELPAALRTVNAPGTPNGTEGLSAADAAGEDAEHGHDRTDEPAVPSPLGVERTATGHPEVDALLERLGDADHLPADEHLEVYEDVHGGLRDTLTALDAHPRPGSPNEHRS
ncbi:hypothetical protein [Streptomyces sp. TRM49041]|uniref:hypothetical protein n=1 Tax=Streptomyces sp. TRM49041 TaxID=2603216 RepID=UPI0037DA4CD9